SGPAVTVSVNPWTGRCAALREISTVAREGWALPSAIEGTLPEKPRARNPVRCYAPAMRPNMTLRMGAVVALSVATLWACAEGATPAGDDGTGADDSGAAGGDATPAKDSGKATDTGTAKDAGAGADAPTSDAGSCVKPPPSSV